jgi:hypothetical protein
MSRRHLSEKNEMDRELALTAIAAYPDTTEASEFLQAEHELIASPRKLEVFAQYQSQSLQEVRQRLAPVKEAKLRHDLQDTAGMATAVTQAAIQRTGELLEEGRIQDPAKAARDMSQVMTQSVDKRALLEGKPTQIVQKRSTEEILRALESKGVVQRPEIDLPEAEVVEDG